MAERLHGVLDAKFRLVVGHTGHEIRGEVLVDAAAVAGDLLASFHERLLGILTELLDGADELDRAGLPARDAALLLLDATTGIEFEDAPAETLGVRLRQLVELALRGLERRS